MTTRTSRRTFLALLIPSLLPAQEQFAIITQVGNPHGISHPQLKRVLLGQEAHWAGGARITLILGPSGDPARIAALKQLAGITESDLYKNVMHLNFTGQGDLAPVTVPSTASVIQAVKSKPGSIGIVPLSAVNPSVKKIEIE